MKSSLKESQSDPIQPGAFCNRAGIALPKSSHPPEYTLNLVCGSSCIIQHKNSKATEMGPTQATAILSGCSQLKPAPSQLPPTQLTVLSQSVLMLRKLSIGFLMLRKNPNKVFGQPNTKGLFRAHNGHGWGWSIWPRRRLFKSMDLDF